MISQMYQEWIGNGVNMRKKKIQIILFTICFILLTGILYTNFYMKPRIDETILLEEPKDSMTEEVLVIQDSVSVQQEEIVEESKNSELITEEKERLIYVHICGEVKKPGVYQLDDGARLVEVVECAGGLSKEAATEYVNLAQCVVDGMRYYIPNKSEVKEESLIEGIQLFDYSVQDVSSSDESKLRQNGQTDGLININTATKEELMTLSGVGASKADSIIEYRESVEKYKKIQDIMKVEGIKEGLFKKIQSKITVDD